MSSFFKQKKRAVITNNPATFEAGGDEAHFRQGPAAGIAAAASARTARRRRAVGRRLERRR